MSVDTLFKVMQEIGTPIVIITGGLLSALWKKSDVKLASYARVITLVALALYLPIELYSKFNDTKSAPELKIAPTGLYSCQSDGTPSPLTIMLTQGEDTVSCDTIPPFDPQVLSDRDLTLDRDSSKSGFVVKSGVCNHYLKSVPLSR